MTKLGYLPKCKSTSVFKMSFSSFVFLIQSQRTGSQNKSCLGKQGFDTGGRGRRWRNGEGW
jgi:hypothetical protein